MQKVKILVVTHKKYRMPDDNIYLPIQVGVAEKGNIGYTRDNTGDNISEKNPSFCELTALYWGWKNLNCSYIGLSHYRRHFSVKLLFLRLRKDKFDIILNHKELFLLLDKYDVIVPRKRRYWIETLYSHYAHTHYAIHLDETRNIIREFYPAYLNAYDRVLKQHSAHMFNMMIMKKEYLDAYCEWMFHILFELEKRIPKQELSSYQGRFYGRVSEIIFNVWLEYQVSNQNIPKKRIKEIGCLHMEKINWNRKITSFIKAKFGHKKYEGSF